jgi:predicted nucleotidyltransferase
MSIKLLKNTEFLSNVKEFYQKYKKQVEDIVLFGSSVKGKEKPKDIDILLIFNKKEYTELNYQLKKSLKEFNVQIISKTKKSLLSDMFKAKESYLSEGYSLISKKIYCQYLWILLSHFIQI